MNQIVDDLVSIVKKHAPEILIAIGTAGIIGGTVAACKETREVDDILEDHKDQMDLIHESTEKGYIVDENTKEEVEYTDKDARKDTTMVYLKTGFKLFKLYLPSGLLISGSIGCIIGSHSIMAKRNAGLSAAYVGLSEAFNNYRKNIIEKYGDVADTEARFNVKANKPKGKKNDDRPIEYESEEEIEEHDFSRFFDADSKYWDRNVNMDLITIYSAQTALNKRLKERRSHEITFNEIAAELDLRPDYEKGRVMGIKFRPGVDKDKLDENGIPQILKIMVYVLRDGKKILKPVDEARMDGDNLDPVMLLDFQGLEPLM